MRTALVTGGARRIGRAIVEHLAERGYAVAIHCNSSVEEAETLQETIVGAGDRAIVVRADLADPDAAQSLVAEASAALGPLTLLVNNASLFEADELETLDAARWARQFAVNLQAPVFLTRAFARQLPEGVPGSVVNLLDQRVWKTTPYFFSYSLSKSALLTATRTMAQALAPRVRVNAVGPGPTLPSVGLSMEDFVRRGETMPLGRGANPREVAEAVHFLAGASSITGQMLAVDGGQHMAWKTPDVLARTSQPDG